MFSRPRTTEAEKAAGTNSNLVALLVPSTRVKATGAFASAGSIVGGTAGGSAGAVVGAACGVVPALFTFGLSIPVGAVVGAVAGSTAGSSLGALFGGATGYVGFTYKKEIKDVAKQAGKAAENGKDYALYLVDVQMWKLRGEAFYAGRYIQKDAASRCPMIQAFGANTFVQLKDVHPRLQDLDAEHHRGDISRHNWLGPTKLANSVFVDGIFSLGTSPKDHRMCREFLDQSLWGDARQWSEEKVILTAKAFVDKHQKLKMPSAAKEFAVAFMAEHWLGLRVPEEFDPVKFRKYQDNRFLMSLMPDMALKLPLMRSLTDKLVTKEDEEYVKIIETAIQKKYPYLVAGKNLRLLAATALDALTFAGGLSVGEITARVLAGLWNKHGDLGVENFRLSRSNIDQVIFETCRLFPAVSNVAYDRKTPFKGDGTQVTGREILAIGPVMQDPASWGKDASEFRLRGAQAYSEKQPAFCPFAEGAVHRMCPGKDLAVSLVRALVLEINSRPWKVQRQWIHTLPLPMPVPIPCGVGPTKVWFFGYSNEDFTVELLS